MSRSRLMRRRLLGQVPEPAAGPGALDVVSDYAAAIIARDPGRMKALRASSYILDPVHLDAFKIAPQGPGAGEAMYAALFAAFPDSDFEVLRTIAGEVVVVHEWRFSGKHTGPLLSAGPVPGAIAPTGRQVRLRSRERCRKQGWMPEMINAFGYESQPQHTCTGPAIKVKK